MTIARDLSKILDANGDLTIDTSTLFVDSSTNRVGIGTTSPSVPLEVSGSTTTIKTYGSAFNQQTHDCVSGAFSQTAYQVGGVTTGLIGANSSNMLINTGANASADIIFATGSGTTERMRINGSGNVLVGKTSIGIGTEGVELRQDRLVVSRDGGSALQPSRLTSDGAIIDLYKDTTAIGGVGVSSDDLYIASTTSGHKGLRFGNGAIVPTNTSGGTDDNATTLGGATQRFANLYLGGNIYLGGTGSANALDDYEEGTFTPTLNNLSGTLQTAKYRKIGDVVHIHLYYTGLGGGSASDAYVSGLPFSIPVSQYSPFIVSTQASNAGLSTHLMGRVDSGTSRIYFYNNNDNRLHGTVIDGGAFLAMQISYFTS